MVTQMSTEDYGECPEDEKYGGRQHWYKGMDQTFTSLNNFAKFQLETTTAQEPYSASLD